MSNISRSSKTLPVAVAFVVTQMMFATSAIAQVPVIDSATLSQATQTAKHTADIMSSNNSILSTVNKTLEAVTGNRSTQDIAKAALGSGFSMGGAPDFSSLMGGQMSWGNLGSFGTKAANILNALNLVKTLSGNLDQNKMGGTDKAYQSAINTASALTGMISGTQSSAQQRSQAFQQAGQQIGTAPDIKGSIDQNSQLQNQTAQTVNELIGVMNAGNAAMNAQQMQELAAQAHAARIMSYDPSKVILVKP